MSTTKMTAAQIKAGINREVEIVNKRDKAAILALYDEILSPDVVVHSMHNPAADETRGLDSVKKSLNLTTFPDMRYAIESIAVEGDRAFIRRTWTGTQKGNLAEGTGAAHLAPTGRKIAMTQFIERRYKDGKVAEQWTMANRLSFYHQLGITPTPEMR